MWARLVVKLGQRGLARLVAEARLQVLGSLVQGVWARLVVKHGQRGPPDSSQKRARTS